MSRKYYVICDDDCKFESMTKEQILAAIEQAVSTGSIQNIDAGFITKVKELNNGDTIEFWRGTEAEYNAKKETLGDNVIVFMTDGGIETIEDSIEKILNGTQAVGRAKKADNTPQEELVWSGKLKLNDDTTYTRLTGIGELLTGETLRIYFVDSYRVEHSITIDSSFEETIDQKVFGTDIAVIDSEARIFSYKFRVNKNYSNSTWNLHFTVTTDRLDITANGNTMTTFGYQSCFVTRICKVVR